MYVYGSTAPDRDKRAKKARTGERGRRDEPLKKNTRIAQKKLETAKKSETTKMYRAQYIEKDTFIHPSPALTTK